MLMLRLKLNRTEDAAVRIRISSDEGDAFQEVILGYVRAGVGEGFLVDI